MPPILPPANSNNARPPPPSGNILLDLHWVRFKILSVIMPQLHFGIKDGKLNCYCPFYNKSCQIATCLHVLQLIIVDKLYAIHVQCFSVTITDNPWVHRCACRSPRLPQLPSLAAGGRILLVQISTCGDVTGYKRARTRNESTNTTLVYVMKEIRNIRLI